MAASKSEISSWFDEGVKEGATHMIVVCDTYDYEDYPVFVKPTQDVREVAKAYASQSMQTIMEVYSLKKDKKEQMAQHRAFNWE